MVPDKMSTCCVVVPGTFLVIAIQNRQFSNCCNWTAIIHYETKYVILAKVLIIQREKWEGNNIGSFSNLRAISS